MPVISAAVTVSLVPGAEMPETLAVIVVSPAAIPVATPLLLSIVATAVLLEAQLTWLVISAVDLSV